MSNVIVNQYGDNLVTTDGYGVDIASQRVDELDKIAIEDVLRRTNPKARCVDLGCGLGWQGIRFSFLGAFVHLFDILPESTLLRALRMESRLSLLYTRGDLRTISGGMLPDFIDLAFSQRFIHHLTFAEATRLVGLISARLVYGSCFYLSASGLNSELGEDYAGATLPVQERYSNLNGSMQAKHDIRQPVCLYTEADLTELMSSSALSLRRVWTSKFGNIKGVYQKL
jgi:hypothetical protein